MKTFKLNVKLIYRGELYVFFCAKVKARIDVRLKTCIGKTLIR